MVNGRALPGVWKLEVRGINEALERHAEDYVYVGGVAVSVLHKERATKDIDVVARQILDPEGLIEELKKRGWSHDAEHSNEERFVFWKELVRGYQNALEVWNNRLVEKEFDELVWSKKTIEKIRITERISAAVPTICVEDLIASKVGHEGIQWDDKIDVINLLNTYWKELDYAYLKEGLDRWKLYEVFPPELEQTLYLPGLKRMIDFSVQEVIRRLKE